MNIKPKRLSDLDRLRLEIQRKFPVEEFAGKSFPGFKHVPSKLSRLVDLGELAKIRLDLRSSQRSVNFKVIKLKEVIDPNTPIKEDNEYSSNPWAGLMSQLPHPSLTRQKLGARHVIR